MKLAWLTDIHLNFLKNMDQINKFIEKVKEKEPDAILLTGDIAEARYDSKTDRLQIEDFLIYMAAKWHPLQIMFCLGNHDYYYSNIDEVRSRMIDLMKLTPSLLWMPAVEYIEFSKKVCMVGHDGWADGRLGTFFRNDVMVKHGDFEWIHDFMGLSRGGILSKMESLGDQAAKHLRKVLPNAMENYEKVIVLTHVPPFAEASFFKGKPTNDVWLPFTTCKAVGDVLLEMAKKYPQSKLVVLCGHTHGAAHVSILPNLEVFVGAARYGSPTVQKMINISDD